MEVVEPPLPSPAQIRECPPPSPSPVLMRLRLVVWGTKGVSGWPVNAALRLRARGGPCRTANTPALGRGCGVQEAQSPAANTYVGGWSVDVWGAACRRRSRRRQTPMWLIGVWECVSVKLTQVRYSPASQGITLGPMVSLTRGVYRAVLPPQ